MNYLKKNNHNRKKLLSDFIARNGDVITKMTLNHFFVVELIANIPYLSNILFLKRIFKSYSNMRLYKRIEKLVESINSIPNFDKETFLLKFETDEERKKVLSYLLNVIESINDEDKVDMEINLFQAFLQNLITLDELMRFTHLINLCFSQDIIWLNSFKGKIYLHSSLNLQTLIGTGLVEQEGTDLGDLSNNSGGYYYKRSAMGEKFCNIVMKKHSPLDIDL